MAASTAVPRFLRRQIGPLPLWAWVLAVVGGIVVARLYKQWTGDAAADDAARKALDAEADGDLTVYPTDDPAGAVSLLGTGVQVPTGPNVPTTNDEWRRLALARLISTGADPSSADTMLAHYFEGRKLTPAEDAMLDLVLLALGQPPDPPVLLPDDPIDPVDPVDPVDPIDDIPDFGGYYPTTPTTPPTTTPPPTTGGGSGLGRLTSRQLVNAYNRRVNQGQGQYTLAQLDRQLQARINRGSGFNINDPNLTGPAKRHVVMVALAAGARPA